MKLLAFLLMSLLLINCANNDSKEYNEVFFGDKLEKQAKKLLEEIKQIQTESNKILLKELTPSGSITYLCTRMQDPEPSVCSLNDSIESLEADCDEVQIKLECKPVGDNNEK